MKRATHKSRRPTLSQAEREKAEIDEFYTFEMHTLILEEVAAQFQALQREKAAYIAQSELTPQSERTEEWKVEHKRRIEEYYEKLGAIGDRWSALDAAVEQKGPSGVN